jgi:hypothetical protein
VESQCEHTVRLLLARAKYETYMPRIRVRGGRILPLFPSYPVMWTPRVIRLLMSGDKPARLPEKTVDEIRKRQVGGFVKLPLPPRLKRGQQVRIVRGYFEGQIAVYEGMTGKDRERVLLDLLGQKVSVELPDRDLEPLLPVVSR